MLCYFAGPGLSTKLGVSSFRGPQNGACACVCVSFWFPVIQRKQGCPQRKTPPFEGAFAPEKQISFARVVFQPLVVRVSQAIEAALEARPELTSQGETKFASAPERVIICRTQLGGPTAPKSKWPFKL